MKIRFLKMQGAGNDFILIDEFQMTLISEERKPTFVKKISDRHFGVGSDGVIFVQKSKKQDAKFHFFNPDGSIAEICGNGLRCFAKYLYESGIVKKNFMSIETNAGTVKIKLIINKNSKNKSMVSEVRVDMGKPRLKRGEIPVSGKPDTEFINQEVRVNDKLYKITAIGMGNPHAIILCNNIDDIDVVDTGRRIRYDKGLFPNGVNVHFIEKVGDNEFKIRSYERGVEGETLACGTGICASAVAVAIGGIINPEREIIFHAKGGDLKVELKDDRVYLTGDANEVFRGEIYFSDT